MALNDYQKLSRVGSVWGDGSDGDLTISSNTQQSLTTEGCSGTSGSTSLTVDSASFSNGDVVLIHQSRGSNAGDWEINKVSSGGGTTSLTMSKNLQTSYANSGDNQAQIIKIPQYENVTVNNGDNWYPAAWNGGENGILVFAASGTLTVNGTIHANYRGFRGGAADDAGYNDGPGYEGEGTGGASDTKTWSANGNGGSGGGGGPGGGNGTAGTPGEGSSTPEGGNTAGNSGLTSMVFGGGGGGGGDDSSNNQPGKDGGGIIAIFAEEIDCSSGLIESDGETPADAPGGSAGGPGAGGSILLVGESIDVGSNKVQCVGGSEPDSEKKAGAGGDGRIAVYYGDTLSGSISSTYYGTYSSEEDSSLLPTSGALFMGQL